MNADSAIEPGRYIHATAVLLGACGVLIRGASKVGKSSLADFLIDAVNNAGGSASLVGDDRVALRREGNEIWMRGHPAITGLIERRGIGIEAVVHTDHAPLRLIVDLILDRAALPPTESAGMQEILGLMIPRLLFDRSVPREQQVAAILAQLMK